MPTSSPPLVTVARPADLLPPLAVLGRLSDRPHAFARLVGAKGHRGASWSYVASDPVEVLAMPRWPRSQSLADALVGLRPRRRVHHGPRVPFVSGWAGSIGYEARSGVEETPPRRRPPLGFPVLSLARYEGVLAYDHATGRAFVTGSGASLDAAKAAAGRVLARAAGLAKASAPLSLPVRAPRGHKGPEAFRQVVAAAREAVRRGDIFQANVSNRFDARIEGPAVALFERLVESLPAPYMTYVDVGGGRHVLSASPERFLRVRGRRAETDPMKGTRPRGGTRAEDRRLRQELADSAKEQAELAMIVDLSRNDLARVSTPGTVRVRVPRRLLAFATVHQAIAVVEGRLRRGLDRVDLLQAAFPPGSVTGAPKVRAMEIIDELEGEGRGPYCGALGWLDDAGDMDLSVAIRTMLHANGRVSYRVGGGITLRSDPEEERLETRTKGTGLLAALTHAEVQA